MIQRLLYTSLKTGIEAIKTDMKILDQLFGEMFELSDTEVAAIKTAFTTKTPNVIHGYARTDSEFPLYSIVLGAEGESETYLGDDAGMVDDPEDEDFGAEVLSSIWESTFQILCYTEHPDMTVYYYEIAKSILLAADLYSWGVVNFHISGMDLMPDPRYIPEHLFARQLTFKGQYEFQRLDRGSRLGKAFKVAGMHVDKSGSPSDVGGVKTLVKPVGILEEEEG